MRSVFCLTLASIAVTRLSLAIGSPMRSFSPLPRLIPKLPVLARQQIEHQTIVRAAVNVMTLPLPADEAEAEALYEPERRVALRHPGLDHVQAELAEGEREEPRPGERAVAAVAEGLVARRPPEDRAAGPAVDVVQRGDADGRVVPRRGVQANEVRVALRHDLEQRRRDELPAVAEIQPLVVLLLRQPARGQLEPLGKGER